LLRFWPIWSSGIAESLLDMPDNASSIPDRPDPGWLGSTMSSPSTLRLDGGAFGTNVSEITDDPVSRLDVLVSVRMPLFTSA